MRYRIGEISRLVDLPTHVIRFYETQGIVNPDQRSTNNYRHYNSLDVCKLLNSKLYRSLGFSLAESAELINNCSHEQVKQRLTRRAARIDEAIADLQRQRLRLRELQSYCESLEECLTGFHVIERRGIYWVAEGKREDLFLEEGSEEIIRHWMKKLPCVYFTGVFPAEALLGEKDFDYSWGIAINEEDMEHFPGEKMSLVKYFPHGRYAHAVIEREDTHEFLPQHFSGVLQLIAQNGMKVKGAALVQLIEIVRENGRMLYRFGVSVPV
ncbi:MAG: MerR family transcriptional regulator [Clostridiales bacterium]|nr:MerR family transcriptional regulator [Eubacteriales bacterium]MDH7566594.1 MerR family transcriptional regulator [Clostridiales bacterium]